jgi:hypothetical protein
MKIAANQLSLISLGACLAILLPSLGCAYALPAPNPPSSERVRIVATSPDAYVLHVDAVRSVDYQVPTDGRVTLTIPAYRHGCSVYLFTLMKVSNGNDPLKEWALRVSANGGDVRKLSLWQLSKLPTDPEGYRLIKVAR